MTFSPEQSRKVAAAQEESLRHARYSQADRTRDTGERTPYAVPAIEKAAREVEAARIKENNSIAGGD
jgi:hypothetical protein